MQTIGVPTVASSSWDSLANARITFVGVGLKSAAERNNLEQLATAAGGKSVLVDDPALLRMVLPRVTIENTLTGSSLVVPRTEGTRTTLLVLAGIVNAALLIGLFLLRARR